MDKQIIGRCILVRDALMSLRNRNFKLTKIYSFPHARHLRILFHRFSFVLLSFDTVILPYHIAFVIHPSRVKSG